MITLNRAEGVVDDFIEYERFLLSNIGRFINREGPVLEALVRLEKTDDPEDSAFLKLFIYDVLEWLKNPREYTKPDDFYTYYKSSIFKKAKRRAKASPLDFENLRKEYGISLNERSTLMRINIEELLLLCAYKFNVSSEIEKYTPKEYLMEHENDFLKLRKKALFNETIALTEILEREHKEDILLLKRKSKKIIYTQDREAFSYLGEAVLFHLEKQEKKGERGFSEFYNVLREVYHSLRQSEEFAKVNPLQIAEVGNYIDVNAKAIRELILEEENEFLNLLVKKTYDKIFANTKIFHEEYGGMRRVILNLLLYNRPVDEEPKSKNEELGKLKQGNTISLEYYLDKNLPNEPRFNFTRRLLRAMEDHRHSHRRENKLVTLGYEISLLNSPFINFFDAMGNYCLSGGSYFRFMDIGVQPAALRDFGIDYILNDSVFKTLGLRAVMDDYTKSAVLAKANTFLAEKVTRLGKKESAEPVLVVDDVPGIDGLGYFYEGWIEDMYHAVMAYAANLRSSGMKIDSVIFNVNQSKAQKSVRQFSDFVKSRKEAYCPEQKSFDLSTGEKGVAGFEYNLEIRTEQVSNDLINKLRKGGYKHYVGQHCIDATFGWYDFMERNLDLIPEAREELYGPLTETRGQIKGLMNSNDALFKHKAPRAAYNFGNGLMTGVEVNIDEYLGKPIAASETIFAEVRNYATV